MDINTIYNDFTTKLLPKVAEGVQITQEYFSELFGRYAHYLFITDVMTAVALVVLTLAAISAHKKVWKLAEGLVYYRDWGDKETPQNDNMYLVRIVSVTVLTFVCIFSTTGAWGSIMNAVKAYYVPEVRVYEELKPVIQQATN